MLQGLLLITAIVLTPPNTSEPCTPIKLPDGSTMCTPKEKGEKVLKVYGTISTSDEQLAKRWCFDRAGAGSQVIWSEKYQDYTCIKIVDK